MIAIAQTATREVVTIDRHCSVRFAHELMKARGFRHLLVVGDYGLEGVISDRDVLLASTRGDRGEVVAPEKPIAEVMSRHPRTVRKNQTVAKVAEIMVDEKIDCLPILDDDGVYGIVTSADLLELLADLSFDEAQDPMPFDFKLIDYRELPSTFTSGFADSAFA